MPVLEQGGRRRPQLIEQIISWGSPPPKKMKARCIWTISLVIFTMMFAIVASRNAVADIVGLWLLDEGKGDVAVDSSGRGHDGKITGCKWVDGKIEKALRFEAGNTMEVPHHDDFNVRENMTIQLGERSKKSKT